MKIRLFIFTAVVFVAVSCLNQEPATYLQKAHYNAEKNMLRVNLEANPDTSLHQVILLSGIRENGYGLLIGSKNEPMAEEASDILFKLVKLDINAVHHLIAPADTLPDPVFTTAISGAKFVWLLSEDTVLLKAIDEIRNSPEVDDVSPILLVINSPEN